MASYTTSVEQLMTGRPGGGVPGGGYVPGPTLSAYSDEFAVDPAVRSPKDAGYVQTRARFTSIPRTYHIRYTALTTHDKDLILNFERTVNGGSGAFTWRRPDTSTSLSARFLGVVRYSPWQPTNYTRWNVEFDIETVEGV